MSTCKGMPLPIRDTWDTCRGFDRVWGPDKPSSQRVHGFYNSTAGSVHYPEGQACQGADLSILLP